MFRVYDLQQNSGSRQGKLDSIIRSKRIDDMYPLLLLLLFMIFVLEVATVRIW